MALEIAERAVVRDDLEPVAQGFEAAARAVAAVRAVADEGGQELRAPRAVQTRDRGSRGLLARARGLEQQRGEQALLVAFDLEQANRRALVGVRVAIEAEPGDPALGRGAAPFEVGDPLAAALGPLDARDEARHHRLDRGED